MFTAKQILEKDKFFTEEYQRILTGYSDIDLKCDFLRRGQVSLLVARPGMGETAFALNITANLLKAGKKILYFSFDQKSEALIHRLLDIKELKEAELDRLYVEDAYYSDAGLRKLIEKVNTECTDVDLIIFDSINPVVDSVQWLYKAFSNAATLVLTKASRNCENRENHHVLLTDISDLNLFNPYVYSIGTLYRDGYYNEWDEERNNIMQFTLIKGETQNTQILLQVGERFNISSHRVEIELEEG